jgi:hypothetical protein
MQSKMFVAPLFNEGELLSTYTHRSLTTLGRKPLSFHAVSFGLDVSTASLRRMAQLALDMQNNAPRDPLLPDTASVPSSFTTALDTVSTRASHALGNG